MYRLVQATERDEEDLIFHVTINYSVTIRSTTADKNSGMQIMTNCYLEPLLNKRFDTAVNTFIPFRAEHFKGRSIVFLHLSSKQEATASSRLY